VASLAARELEGSVAIVLPAMDLAVIAPPEGEHRLAPLRRYVSDRLLGLPADPPDGLVSEVAVTSGDERLGSVMLLGRVPHPRADEVLQLAALAAVTSVALEQGAGQTQARARLALLELVRESPPPHPGRSSRAQSGWAAISPRARAHSACESHPPTPNGRSR
jgi:hypothetical protein